MRKKWFIHSVDTEYDSVSEDLGIFLGTKEEAITFTASLIRKALRSEPAEAIEYITKGGSLICPDEAFSIVRPDSTKTFYVTPYEEPKLYTVADLTKEDMDFAKRCEEGLESDELKELFKNS